MSGWLPDGMERWGGRPVARTVAEAAPRSRAVLSGAVRSLAVRRRSVLAGTRRVASHRAGTGAWLEVELDDGTGVVALRWMGRAHVPGVEVGARLTVEGTVLDDRGRPVLINPLYRFAHSSSS